MVISAANGSVGTLEWESDQRSVSWPANLKLENDSSYSITIEESAAIEVTVLLVPEDLESDAHRVVWLSKAGCKQQAQALLNNL